MGAGRGRTGGETGSWGWKWSLVVGRGAGNGVLGELGPG